MTHSISFAELINLAIGTPELGNVNFNALHLFLHSLLDHLHLKDMKKEITDDELDFIKPPKDLATSVATSEVVQPARKSSSIFHQLHDRVVALEKQLNFLNEAPTTAELLARSQGAAQPAQDMWQIMQLKKKMEMNEAGMTKVSLPESREAPSFLPLFPGQLAQRTWMWPPCPTNCKREGTVMFAMAHHSCSHGGLEMALTL